MIEVTQQELQRVKVIENAAMGRLSVAEAARVLDLSERQAQRWKARYRAETVDWVRHGNRGRVGEKALPLPASCYIRGGRKGVGIRKSKIMK
ncbi:MAG TPA: helix-turn-helix domain-containing protein [Bryobacterales bacterium]|nr:helix-turn-helix domain-containing protein [Bryobacterales bacterium]